MSALTCIQFLLLLATPLLALDHYFVPLDQDAHKQCEANCRILNSCKEILEENPSAKDGFYYVTDGSRDHTHERYTYCKMDTLCGKKGWTRIAYERSNFNIYCGLYADFEKVYLKDENLYTCRRRSAAGTGCLTSRTFESKTIQYSEVCGRVIGYQSGSPDAFDRPGRETGSLNINSNYVDGISITRGSPREHIWTLAAGKQAVSDGSCTCPCNATGLTFVGDDYSCESAITRANEIATDDPLWDNKNCDSSETHCCNKGFAPYFYKDLKTATDDGIELRYCRDGGRSEEDILVTGVELYVR